MSEQAATETVVDNTSTDAALMASAEPPKVEPEEKPVAAAPEDEKPAEPKAAAEGQVKEVEPPEERVAVAADGKPVEPEKPAAPEKYELTISKDSPLSTEVIERIVSDAKEQGLSNDDAQKLLDSEHRAVKTYTDTQKSELAVRSKQWIEDVKSDTEMGGEHFEETCNLAEKVIDKFASESLKQILHETRLGNHPELIRVFATIGRTMEPGKLIMPNANNAKKQEASAEDKLYGETKEK